MTDSPAEPIRFRAGKKRKAYRQRVDDDGESSSSLLAQPAVASPTASHDQHQQQQTPSHEQRGNDTNDNYDDDDDGSVAAALRLRNARRARLNGVGFTTRPDDQTSNPETNRTVVLHTNPDEAESSVVVGGIAKRFAHQTGRLTGFDDRHMNEYIESRLSNRSAPQGSSQLRDRLPTPSTSSAGAVANQTLATTSAPKPEGQSVMQGRLMEIDIDEIALNQKGNRSQSMAVDGNTRNKRPRLGKDGKPWRGRNRRTSDDIKRDQLVEDILRESKLDVYDVPAEKSNGAEEDGAADERLAEEFRRQFLDDVASRKLKQKKKQSQPAKPGNEEVLKGPKLGGSRNMRAAVRNLLLKKEKEGRK